MENKRVTMRELEKRRMAAEQELQDSAINWATCTLFNPLEQASAKMRLDAAGAKYRSALRTIELRRVRDGQ